MLLQEIVDLAVAKRGAGVGNGMQGGLGYKEGGGRGRGRGGGGGEVKDPRWPLGKSLSRVVCVPRENSLHAEYLLRPTCLPVGC